MRRAPAVSARRLAPLAVTRLLSAAEVRPEDVVDKEVGGSVGLLGGLVGQEPRRRWQVG